jgi:hypothetical protein
VARRKRRKLGGRKASLNGRRRKAQVVASESSGTLQIVSNLSAARTEILAQRAALDEQIEALDRALTALVAAKPGRAPARGRRHVVKRGPKGPRRGGRGRGRGGRREGSLKAFIAKVMAAHPGSIAVKDITAAVLSSGYKTKNRTLAKSIGIALTQMPEVTKVGRGLFRMK